LTRKSLWRNFDLVRNAAAHGKGVSYLAGDNRYNARNPSTFPKTSRFGKTHKPAIDGANSMSWLAGVEDVFGNA
jgi:hypothetical protein